MTTITLPRAVVEQALHVAESAAYPVALIKALRAALAHQAEPAQAQRCRAEPRSDGDFVCDCKIGDCSGRSAEPAQEPVAWSGYDLDGMVEAFSRVIEAHYQRANPFQYPIHMDAQMALRVLRGFIPAMKAYTAPPQRKLVPLTEEEIERIGMKHVTLREVIRAVERAHEIKE